MEIRTVPYADPVTESGHVTGWKKMRRLVFGSPIATQQAHRALLPKVLALPVFASDAISSVVYATQQIILALGVAGLWVMSQREAYTHYTMLLSGLIVLLLVIVVASYWQTIYAYPNGGGSYIVSKRNLGIMPGLVAAAALLIDYVLTVSVSIASGVQNLRDVPLFAPLHIKENMVLYCIIFVALLTLANLRGLKESGKMFAIPTYVFVAMCYLMIFLGLVGPFIGWQFHPQYVNQDFPGSVESAQKAAETFGIVVLLRAFANGCSAMTGTEAVSNGVPAFQEPRSANAAQTLLYMGLILGSLFLGISWLAMNMHVVYWEANGNTAPAVIDQLSGAVFGKVGPFSWAYIVTQVFTALILVLAANTSFADFPRLSSILARDGFMPRQLSNLGDKLVFNNGIIVLGILSALLIAVKNGSVDALIPLYAIGVFLAFTLSQAGMVNHWRNSGEKRWQMKACVNGFGALATGIVLLDIAAEKFMDGAWFIMVLVVVLVWLFRKVYAHYADVSDQLRLLNYEAEPLAPIRNTALILVQGINVGTMQALDYARSLSHDCTAIHVELDPERTKFLKERWSDVVSDVPLVVLESPYRSLLGPIMHYLDVVHAEKPNCRITVVIGEFVPTKWWHSLLHGNTGLLLKLAFLGRYDVSVANVRYRLEKRHEKPRKGLGSASGNHPAVKASSG
ncbi:MAG TPA: APC family permease [Candidatus Obscuribacterales bacterium]